MTAPSVTNTFTNGTTADATAVNQNFTDLITAMTDGQKSFSIDALTCTGSATFNGAVNLGNATGDDVTVTGYLASALIPKTDDTYDLGTAALAWQDAYFDGAVYTDTISELGSGAGITIDGLLVKDLGISAAGAVSLGSTGAGVNVTTHNSAGDDFTVNTTALVVEGDTGFIGIGTTSPATQLHLAGGANGTIRLDGSANSAVEFYEAGGRKFQVIVDGSTFYIFDEQGSGKNAYLGASFTAWTFASDRRLKENITNLDSGLDKILNVTPRRFNFIGNSNEEVGFIAQELKPVVPEAVSGEEIPYGENDTQTERANKSMGVSSTTLIPYLVKSIQEQQAQIEELKKEIANLKQ